jgi:hypothetical protein
LGAVRVDLVALSGKVNMTADSRGLHRIDASVKGVGEPLRDSSPKRH